MWLNYMAEMKLGGALVGILIAAAVGAAIVLDFVGFFTGRCAGQRTWS